MLEKGLSVVNVHIGFIQTYPLFGQIKRNLDRVKELFKDFTADLVVLPELFNTGYFFTSSEELFELAEDIKDGISVNFLKEIASYRSIFIVAGIAEKDNDNFYNSSVLISPEGDIKVYRKAHLFYKEKLVFKRGNLPFSVHSTGAGKIGMMICFDWIFPEACRTLALKGADIICHPSNLVLPHCPAAMLVRSLENRLFTITANRIGSETKNGETLTFIGRSQIVNPLGEIILKAGAKSEEALSIEVNLKEASNKKITDYNDLLGDRRPDLYSDLTE